MHKVKRKQMAHRQYLYIKIQAPILQFLFIKSITELHHEKTNNVVADQVRHKQSYTSTEAN